MGGATLSGFCLKKKYSVYRVKTGRELTGEDLLGNYSNNLGER